MAEKLSPDHPNEYGSDSPTPFVKTDQAVGAPQSSPPGGSRGGCGMGMEPGKQGLSEVWVVCAALSCFSCPPPSICRLITLKLGDGMMCTPGEWGAISLGRCPLGEEPSLLGAHGG